MIAAILRAIRHTYGSFITVKKKRSAARDGYCRSFDFGRAFSKVYLFHDYFTVAPEKHIYSAECVAPAKGVGRVKSGAGVRVSPSAPKPGIVDK